MTRPIQGLHDNMAARLDARLRQAPTLVMGMMCGTSLDGIDVGLIEIGAGGEWSLRAFDTFGFRSCNVARVRELAQGATTTVAELSALRQMVVHDHVHAAEGLCRREGLMPSAVAFVGVHGITLAHEPTAQPRHTWQMLSGSALAVALDTVVINDFRSADFAAGGQGAPLVPATDLRWRASIEEDRVLLNLGGVANLTALPGAEAASRDMFAGDVGPANLPLDELRRRQTGGREEFDMQGQLALGGQPDAALVETLLRQPWVRAPLPRSFGREEFGEPFVSEFLEHAGHLEPRDQLATIVEVEARAVASFLDQLGNWRRCGDVPLGVYVTGGGRRNEAVMEALRRTLPGARVEPIEALGENGDAKEAVDFALLAWLTLQAQAAGVAPITGAQRDLVLGCIHAPTL